MTQHPYLRAYMAGVAVPTFVLPIFLGLYALARFAFHVPVPIERLMVFPLALLPFLWGAWNALFFLFGMRLRVPLGIFGALLVPLLGPLAFYLSGTVLGLTLPLSLFLGGVLPFLLVAYYLIWKYFVGFFNRLLGLA